MELELIWPGKTREAFLAAGIQEFLRRLERFAVVRVRCVKAAQPGKKEQPHLVLEEEQGPLLAAVTRPTVLVALAVEGRQLHSEEFAGLLRKSEEEGRRRVSFVVGGHLGLAPGVIREANLVLSLSKMTFTHEMARLLLIEQLYRAFSINAGTGYHK